MFRFMLISTAQTWLCNWKEVKQAQHAPKPPSTEKPEAESTLAKKMAELVKAVDKTLEKLEGCFDKVNWCALYKPKKEAPGGKGWTQYITNTCGKDALGDTRHTYVNKTGVRTHGHHIVLKKGFAAQSEPALRILCKHGIDPYVGCENLVFSPNRCHTQWYVDEVLRRLKAKDEEGAGWEEIAEVLRELARIHRRCEKPGPADENDEVDNP